ncbi:hypothetical protein EVAR_12613_1 [Eumeta japonica]|uniref:Gustatory receptor n=1 Tax=Eumeta variegata TaxID=151549 RepID=A0A4C1UG61_EUMVA|nr:hypothetical protein EVAR_12613_1 [Eumeta japonica]
MKGYPTDDALVGCYVLGKTLGRSADLKKNFVKETIVIGVDVSEKNSLERVLTMFQPCDFEDSVSRHVHLASIHEVRAARGRPIIVEWERRKAFGGPLSFGVVSWAVEWRGHNALSLREDCGRRILHISRIKKLRCKILSIKEEYGPPNSYIIGFGTRLAKVMYVTVVLSAACERLYNEVSELKVVCVDLIQKPTDGELMSITYYNFKRHVLKLELRRMAKKVIRLCSVRCEKFRACGLFTVDAALPLRLAGLVATYSIVLLQFAFL